jgi:hypothetical protein
VSGEPIRTPGRRDLDRDARARQQPEDAGPVIHALGATGGIRKTEPHGPPVNVR